MFYLVHAMGKNLTISGLILTPIDDSLTNQYHLKDVYNCDMYGDHESQLLKLHCYRYLVGNWEITGYIEALPNMEEDLKNMIRLDVMEMLINDPAFTYNEEQVEKDINEEFWEDDLVDDEWLHDKNEWSIDNPDSVNKIINMIREKNLEPKDLLVDFY